MAISLFGRLLRALNKEEWVGDSLKLTICIADSLKAGGLESSKDQKLKSFIYSQNHKLRDYNAIIF